MNKSAVARDDSGADCAECLHVPPKVGAEEPGPSTQVTESVAAEPECGHFVSEAVSEGGDVV